jgi:hypothetical protein
MKKANTVLTMAAIAAMLPVYAQPATNAEREAFLREATVASRKSLSMGVTNSSKAQMTNGSMTHAAHIQTVDIRKAQFQTDRGTELNFRDSYRYNVAAYELAKMLNLDMVPPSVERKIAGEGAAVTWWIDDVQMTELDRYKKHIDPPNTIEWNRQMETVRVFDQLIYNTDRNLGNLVITNDWKIWMIDHTRAFRLMHECQNVKVLHHVDPELLAKLRALDKATVAERLHPWLDNSEIKGLLARRDAIVKYFDGQIAQKGEQAVLVASGRMSD